MRILVAAERLGRAGGMERYLDIVLPALVAQGAQVHVLARELGALPRGVTGERVAWADEHDAPSNAARTEALRALAAFEPDAAVAHNVMDAGIVEALRAAPRLTYHVHDHRAFCPNGDRVFPRSGRICTLPLGRPCAVHSLTDGCAYGPRRRTLTLIRRRERLRDAIAAAHAVVAASDYVAERALASAIPRHAMRVVPLPLANDDYADRVQAPPAGTVVFAGRIVPQKGLGSLVRAVATIAPRRRPAIRALGEGPALADAQADAARLGVTLHAPGAVSHAALRAAIDAAGVVALPSLWAEPFGYVGVEALARGRPVVAYDAGGVRAWLEDGANGFAVPPGDEAAFGAALDALLGDDALRARFGTRAREDAERYRVTPIAATLARTYAGAALTAT